MSQSLVGQTLGRYHILEQIRRPLQGYPAVTMCFAKSGMANSGQRMGKRISGWLTVYPFIRLVSDGHCRFIPQEIGEGRNMPSANKATKKRIAGQEIRFFVKIRGWIARPI